MHLCTHLPCIIGGLLSTMMHITSSLELMTLITHKTSDCQQQAIMLLLDAGVTTRTK